MNRDTVNNFFRLLYYSIPEEKKHLANLREQRNAGQNKSGEIKKRIPQVVFSLQ